MDNRPIGVFDSGIGGITVLSEIKKLLPNENIIYYGDTARVPYGPRPIKEIKNFSLDAAKFLMEKNIKLLVIACNTATAVAYDYLKENIDIPIIGVIDPGVRAVKNSGVQRKLALIATKATLDSMAYQDKIRKNLGEDIKVMAKATPMLVSIVEEGWGNTEISKLAIEKYLGDINKEDVELLILACTHFPVLRSQIRDYLKDSIRIIDPAEETAKETLRTLEKLDILSSSKKKGSCEFYVSDRADKFKQVCQRLTEVEAVYHREIEG